MLPRKFSPVYADPPWPYQNRAARGAAEDHSRTMILEDIRGTPVPQIIAAKARLHLWAMVAFRSEAFEVTAEVAAILGKAELNES